MAINKTWHLNNRMPPRATLEQRIAWHLQHYQNCNCAPIPGRLLEEMHKRGISIPEKRLESS